MTLRITDTGIPIDQRLVDYINQYFYGIYFNEIQIDFNESNSYEGEHIVNITYPGYGPFLRNTLCISEHNLNQSVVDWLKSL